MAPASARSTYIIGREIVPVCHPSILPGIHSPADLLRHPLLYHVEAPEMWQQWCEAYGQPAPKMLDSEFNIMAAAIDAVANNFGASVARAAWCRWMSRLAASRSPPACRSRAAVATSCARRKRATAIR